MDFGILVWFLGFQYDICDFNMNPGIGVLFLGFQRRSWVFSMDSDISVRFWDSSVDSGVAIDILAFQSEF